ncbi:hypothetical protein ES319_D04G053600v1 [Gossypium barbadense]|uniref:Uncharacterized protein n=1 Tax=Gossypium barbadense TaxID=3634 RepID=A0A5J5RUL2_GOSBA|nr:hypothetical protein ES319_D04G053600v1 [Gossypium barbadense]
MRRYSDGKLEINNDITCLIAAQQILGTKIFFYKFLLSSAIQKSWVFYNFQCFFFSNQIKQLASFPNSENNSITFSGIAFKQLHAYPVYVKMPKKNLRKIG